MQHDSKCRDKRRGKATSPFVGALFAILGSVSVYLIDYFCDLSAEVCLVALTVASITSLSLILMTHIRYDNRRRRCLDVNEEREAASDKERQLDRGGLAGSILLSFLSILAGSYYLFSKADDTFDSYMTLAVIMMVATVGLSIVLIIRIRRSILRRRELSTDENETQSQKDVS
jgi:ABC-type uncharacterized transport system permease subunit